MRNPNQDYDAPKWFREALARGEQPREDVLRALARHKAAFLQSLSAEPAAPERPAAGMIDAVFDALGRLKRLADGVISRAVGEPIPFLEPLARLVTAKTPVGPARPAPPVHTKVCKSEQGIRVELDMLPATAGEAARVEVNAIDEDLGMEMRPFDLDVWDADGNRWTETVHVGLADQAPTLPKPPPGVYVFQAQGIGRRATLRIALEPD
jgi:hypothetical protein